MAMTKPVRGQDGECILHIEKLSLWYDRRKKTVPVLRDIDLSIYKGETVALVGESGSGKSSLVNCIMGLHASPDVAVEARKLHLGDVDLPSLSPSDWHSIRGKQIGYVAQDPTGSLNPLVPVGRQLEEILSLCPHVNRQGEIRSRYDELMRSVGFQIRRRFTTNIRISFPAA